MGKGDRKAPANATVSLASPLISVLPSSWNLPGPENYALQYADGVQTYITELVSLSVF